MRDKGQDSGGRAFSGERDGDEGPSVGGQRVFSREGRRMDGHVKGQQRV